MRYETDRKELYLKELFILTGIVLGMLLSKFTGIYTKDYATYAMLLIPVSFIFLYRIKKLTWLFYLIFNSIGFIIFMVVFRALK